MNKNATTKLIAEFYDEGDIDYLFFGYVYSHVKYNRLDNPRTNDTKRLLVATLEIMQLLIKDDDFSLLEAKGYKENVTYSPIKFDFEQLESLLLYTLLQGDINKIHEIEYRFLLKKNKIGKTPASEYPDILGELI